MIPIIDINSYIHNFESEFTLFLKDNTRTKIVVYPYNDGFVLVMRISQGNGSSSDVREPSATVHDALVRTGLIQVKNVSTTFAKNTLLLGKSNFVFIKPQGLFSVDVARRDVNMIIKQIRAK